jgi:hypothetical protein
MCNLHWHIIFQLPTPLTYGCENVYMMFQLLLLTFYVANRRPNMSLLNYLKCSTLVVQLWFYGYNNFWIIFFLPKRSLLMLRMRALICRLVQVVWIQLFHVLAWLWWSHLLGHVLGMPYQRFTNVPLWTKRLP